MTAHQDLKLFPWLLGIINNKPTRAGDFLRSLADAALRADAENYITLRPALLDIRTKYPGYRDESGSAT
jgi:hypothetical protein